MTASRTGLLVLSVIAALLGAIVLLGGGKKDAPTVVSRRLVPDFAAASARRVTIERAGEAPIAIDVPREAGDAADGGAPAPVAGPSLSAPVVAPVEAAALDDLLGAVGLLSWRRRATADEATRAPRATVTIERDPGATPLVIVIGPELPGVDGAWIAVRGAGHDDQGFLVDASLARSLAPVLDALRPKRALRLGDVTGIEAHGPIDLLLSGRPLKIHLAGVGGAARARAERIEVLRDALEAIRFTRFADDADVARPRLLVRIIGEHPRQDLEIFGPCPGVAGETLLRAPPGLGCTDDAAIAAVEAALPPSGVPDNELLATWIEPRLVPPGVAVSGLSVAVAGRYAELRSDAGAAWHLGGGSKVRLDPAAPAVIVAALAIEAGVPVAAGPAPPATSIPMPSADQPDLVRLTIDSAVAADVITIDRRRARARRGAEPVELVVPAEVLAIIDEIAAVGELAVADATLIREEPTAAAAVKMEDLGVEPPLAVFTRGTLVGEWNLVLPASHTPEPDAVNALVQAFARLRAERRLAAITGKLWRRITVAFDGAPPAQEQTSYTIDLTRPDATGCQAQLVTTETIAFTLSRATCDVLTRPLVR